MDAEKYRQAERRYWAEAGATPTEHFVRLPGIGVKVRIMEVGEGAPALFIHGGPSAGSTWAPLAARLFGLRCLVLDRPGTGLSDPYHWHESKLREFFDTLVIDVLDGLGIEQAHLIGSSTGSDFVLSAGARHPERVMRSVHFGCPGFAPGVHVPFIMRLFSLPGLWQLAAKAPLNEKSVLSQMRQMGHGASVDAGRFTHAMTEWYMALHRHTPTTYHEMQGSSILVTPRGIAGRLLHTPKTLASVHSPSYFVWGDQDVFGDVSVGHRLVGLMPNAQLEVLPEAGHLVWLDDPDHAAAVVQRHLLAEERAGNAGAAERLPAP